MKTELATFLLQPQKAVLFFSCSEASNAASQFSMSASWRESHSCRVIASGMDFMSRPITHGHSPKNKPSPTYISWSAMIQRCTNPNNCKYPIYGAMGITVCDRWMSFEKFYQDMGDRPSGHTLNRVLNEQGYSKDNCNWATPKDQAKNSRTNRVLEFRGVKNCFSEWARILDIPRTSLQKLLEKESFEKICTRLLT